MSDAGGGAKRRRRGADEREINVSTTSSKYGAFIWPIPATAATLALWPKRKVIWLLKSSYKEGKYPTKAAAEEAFELHILCNGLKKDMSEFITPGWREGGDDEELYPAEEDSDVGDGDGDGGGAGGGQSAALRCPTACHKGPSCPRLAGHREFLALFTRLKRKAARVFKSPGLASRIDEATSR